MYVKEEQEELWISQEEEQLHDVEEANITKFPFTLVTVKSEEDEEKVQSPQLQKQTEETKESESLISSSTKQTKREADGEDCGGPEPARNTYPEMQQVWSLSVKQEEPEVLHIKEEQEELGTRQEGETLQHLEEADITKFPFTLVTVKTEDDEDKVQSSQLHQSQTEENREAEPLASSSTQQTETGAHVEDCGGPGPTRTLDPGSYLQPACDGSHTGDQSINQSHFIYAAPFIQVNANQSALQAVDKFQKYKAFCSVCGKKFTQSGSLKKHMRIHTGEKPFSCSFCSKNFTQHGSLKKHMRIHTGEKPFSCSLCGNNFTEHGHLTRHMRIHTGEKPFSCSLCGKHFVEHGHLKKHMRIHTGEKPFSCSLCDSNFTERGHLKRHMIIHTGEKPFSCSECGKNFTQSGSLKKHMKIHKGEKLFSCSECGIHFAQSGSLKKHMKIHAVEKPFSYSECDKDFIEVYI